MRTLSFIASLALTTCLLASVGCDSQTDVTDPIKPATNTDTLAPEVTTISFANDKCPIMGGKPKADLTADWNGKTIGFCCDGCPQKWEKLSAEDKAAKFAAAAHQPDTQADQQ